MTLPWPFSLGFEFKKCKRWEDSHRDDTVSTVIEEKLDGWRTLLVCDPESSDLCLYSRGISVDGTRIDLLKKFGAVPDVTRLRLVSGDAIEGELIYPGHRAAEVPSALKDSDLRKQLLFIAYGHPYSMDNPVLTLEDQRGLLNDLPVRRPRDLSFGAHLYSVQDLQHWAKVHKCEGWVIKEHATEDPTWWKYKRETTADVIVVSHKDGKEGKYEGMLGSLIVGVIHPEGEWTITMDNGSVLTVREVAAVSGMDDDAREEMSKDRDALIGRVCEIECQAVGGVRDGRLRHPRFIRWREDKPAHECLGHDLYAQIESQR